MTTLREAAQQALEALKLSTPKTRRADDDYAEQGWTEHNTAITALRAALAQEQAEPVQEPVDAHTTLRALLEHCLSWQPDACVLGNVTARVAAAALKAALAQEQAEPVAWIHTDPDKPRVKFLEWRENEPGYRGRWIKTPLYTAPPQRQPLSGLEVERLLEQVVGSLPVARNLVRAVERAHGIIESQIKVDSHQTLDDAMQQPRAMAQAYERGYNAGVAARDAEHQQTLALQQRSYEREIQLDVEAERERCLRLIDEHVRAVDAEDLVRAIKEGKE